MFCAAATIILAIYLIASPHIYQAEMTILVKNTRAELIVTPDGTSTSLPQGSVSDEQMGTEVQLLGSRELFQKVVEECGLAGPTAASKERAVARLQKKVGIAPLLKSSMIRVRYGSPDPKLSARVLKSLADAYLERHVQLHGSAGSLAFFQAQADIYERKLRDSEQKLLTFQKTSGVVGAPVQKELLIHRLVEQQAALREAQASSNDTTQRIAALRAELAAASPRITTQSRVIPNQYSVERLNTLIAELENKRTELLTKFRPEDRMIKQVDQQLADTRKALENAERMNSTEQATDVNPVRQSIETELARAETTERGLRGRTEALSAQTQQYRSELEKLEGILPDEQELLREIKVDEDNYLLYSRKREEARIGEALDQQKIANVAVADPPVPPALPLAKLNASVAASYVLSIVFIFIGATVIGNIRRTIYTPWELESLAGMPVLATVAFLPPSSRPQLASPNRSERS